MPLPFVAGRGGLLEVEDSSSHRTMPLPASRPHLRPEAELPERRVPPVPPAARAGQGRRFWRSLPAQAGPPAHAGPASSGPGSEEAAAFTGLDAYRRRAGELARELEAVAEPALGTRLTALAVKVAALVADLESVGADTRLLGPLRDLVAELVRPGERPSGLRDRALEALRAFAEERP